MAERQPIQLGSHSYQSRSGRVSTQRLQNLYLEANPQGAKTPTVLLGTPGLKSWASVGDGPIRGMHLLGSSLMVVSGNELYSVTSSKSATLIGEIKRTGPVQMTDNGTHVAIATTGELYAANNDELLQLPEYGMNGATYQDGYGIFSQAQTEKFWLSGLDDMTTIPALDFSTADVFADKLVGCISNHRELWLFGETTTEGWYNSGNALFPFERAQGAFLEIGCAAGGTIAKAQRSVLWLGDDLYVYRAQGYQAQKISTHAIDKLISEANDQSTAQAFVYDQEGHTFYVLSFSDLTLVFDLATGLWHERKSQDAGGRWRVSAHADAFGARLAGDYSTGDLYELDLDTYTENGEEIIREVTAPPISAMERRVLMADVIMDVDAGIGLTTGQGSDPIAFLDWSDDGGKTWSNRIDATVGEIGEYGWQARWNRLGAFRQRSLRFTISDPVKVAILAAYASLEGAAR